MGDGTIGSGEHGDNAEIPRASNRRADALTAGLGAFGFTSRYRFCSSGARWLGIFPTAMSDAKPILP